MDDKDVVGAGVVSAAVQVYPSSPDMFVAEPISRVSTRDSCVAHQLSRQLGQATSMSRVALRGTQRTTAVSRVNVHERSFMNVDRSSQVHVTRHTSRTSHKYDARHTLHPLAYALFDIRNYVRMCILHAYAQCTYDARTSNIRRTYRVSAYANVPRCHDRDIVRYFRVRDITTIRDACAYAMICT